MKVLELFEIQHYVAQFLWHAYTNIRTQEFKVVSIGCGLAGYKPVEIAPMFYPGVGFGNIRLSKEFKEVIRSIYGKVV